MACSPNCIADGTGKTRDILMGACDLLAVHLGANHFREFPSKLCKQQLSCRTMRRVILQKAAGYSAV